MTSGGIMSGSDRPAGSPLVPTFQGYIASTMDALILFEACLSGHLCHVPRRPHDRERPSLIVSGNVFIYEEHSSGIKRWTDGVPWSPSRILGNFLLYRELDKPFQPGEKKRAMKRQKAEGGVSKPASNSRANSVGNYSAAMLNGGASMPNIDGAISTRNEAERALVGSLIDSYQFKHDGLVKKTISVTYQGIQHHMVSYYTIDDVIARKLITPSQAPSLRGITPRPPLISSGSFRAPVDDNELVLAEPQYRGLVATSQSCSSYSLNGAGASSRSMSMPSMHSYGQVGWGSAAGQYAPPYNMTQTLPPPVSYSTTSSYTYDQGHQLSYDMAGRSSVNFPNSASVSSRRHSNMNGAMNGTNGVAGIEYPGFTNLDRNSLGSANFLGSDNSLAAHGLSGHATYTNGVMFETSAISASAANAPASTSGPAGVASTSTSPSGHRRGPYENNGSSQHNGLYNAGLAGQQPSGFDDTIDNGFSHRTATNQVSNEFNTTPPEQQTHNLVSSGPDATSPATVHLGLDNTDDAAGVSLGDADWNVAASFMAGETYQHAQTPGQPNAYLQTAIQRLTIDNVNSRN